MVMLDAKQSVGLKDPGKGLKGGTGDIRFSCETQGCELESDTSVFVQMYGKPGTTLDDCRLFLQHSKQHRLPLNTVANGTEICVRSASGDIALYEVTTKSTAVRDYAFLLGNLTLWRGAA